MALQQISLSELQPEVTVTNLEILLYVLSFEMLYAFQ